MKKRLLITSVVMMLVVAVALSTATYAWFTSNASVTASSITMTASTSTAPALGIGWAGGEAGSAITLGGSASSVSPMVPATLYTQAQANASNSDEITAATISTVGFETATTKSVNGHLVFNTPTPATPYTFTDGTATAFYVSNLSTANTVTNVQVQATISAVTAQKDGTALVRIAIFKRDAAGSGDYKLVGVLAATADDDNVAFGDVQVGANAEKGTGASLSYGASVEYIDLGGLAINDKAANGSDQIDLVAKVWMDGYELDDDAAQFDASISLTFYAAPANTKYDPTAA